MTTIIESHPIADLLPMPTEGEQELLKESIQKDGQRDAIILHMGQILDGRSRYEACVALGLTPISRQYNPETDGPSPTSLVMAKNIFRRHLSAGQRAAVISNAMAHYELEAKERRAATQSGTTTEAQISSTAAADAANVSEGSVNRAKKIKKEAPDLHQQVLAGTITLNQAIKQLAERKADAENAKAQDSEDEGTKERTELAKASFDAINTSLGDEFAKAVRDATVLKTASELQDFLGLSIAEQKMIKELMIRKWTVKKALDFYNQTVSRNDKISDLFLRILGGNGSKMAFEIDGWHVVVSRRKASVSDDADKA